ncbi:GNAT family N-acetyltransferase [Hoeflea poritis]|uniref:GNAT family N-acetyltransferase n=1 Tax=Hoeflea poritis TaxID=2993659 RepID=A0ABT4VW21_9HYPH|nr:GNAT family N-acetyltransferase [Hoeflea poritis]MDA4848894.1 GNAT family N-acetyltransferase [Hoeflea poritis]
MNISFETIGEREVEASASEFLALIQSIEGSSTTWSAAYLMGLVKSEVNLALAVRMQNSELVGLAIVHAVSAINPLILNEPHLFLRRLVISPHFRRAGIGGALMQRVAATIASDARFGSFSKIGWQTNLNNAGGLAFFSTNGFQPVGRITVGSHVDEIFSMDMEEFHRRLK